MSRPSWASTIASIVGAGPRGPPAARPAPRASTIYVELVGGICLWAVLPLMNLHGRMPVIGDRRLVQSGAPAEGPTAHRYMRRCSTRRLRVEGLLVTDHAGIEAEFLREVGALVVVGV